MTFFGENYGENGFDNRWIQLIIVVPQNYFPILKEII
jgi:hypothetical protein